jgi:hypothetical protein
MGKFLKAADRGLGVALAVMNIPALATLGTAAVAVEVIEAYRPGRLPPVVKLVPKYCAKAIIIGIDVSLEYGYISANIGEGRQEILNRCLGISQDITDHIMGTEPNSKKSGINPLHVIDLASM